MKRILSVVLAVVLLLSVTACKNNKKSSNINDANFSIEALVNMENVREFETIDNIRELNKDEEIYYNYIFVEALKTLDIDTISKLSPDYKAVEKLKEVKNDPERKHLWDITFGQYIYLPESRYMIFHSPLYIYCMWMKDAYANQSIEPNEICRYDFNDIMILHSKYYTNALYTASKIDFTTSDNLILFFIETFRTTDPYTAASGNLSEFLFAEEECGFADESFLDNAESFPDWPYFVDMNIDKMTPVIEPTLAGYADFKKEFEYYFKDSGRKAKIQKFIDEKVEIYKTPLRLMYFTPVNKETLNLNEAEAEYIKDVEIYDIGFFQTGYGYHYLLRELIDSFLSYNIVEPFNGK